MASGADLWTAAVHIANLLDEEGNVDPAKAPGAVGKVLEERPHWRRSIWGCIDVERARAKVLRLRAVSTVS